MKKIFTPRQKAVIALEAIKGIKLPSQIAGEYEIHPIQIGKWKKRLAENAYEIFSGKGNGGETEQQDLIDRLYKVIGQRDVEIEWLKKKLHLES